MDFKLQAIFIGYETISQNVVDMAVSIDEPDRLNPQRFNPLRQPFSFRRIATPRINDNSFTRIVINDVSVFLKRIERVNFYQPLVCLNGLCLILKQR